MLKHEAILLDPSPGEIADALSEATTATNQGCRERRLDDSAARWRKFAREATASAEGWRMWHGGRGISVPAAHLLGGWWTDAVGRKHVVIRGRHLTEYEDRIWMEREPLAERDPLWHCYPHRLVRQTDSDRGPVLLAVCGCGAVGTPAALAWMGDCCGPCHDRAEEYGPAAAADNGSGVLTGTGRPAHRLAWHPDGSAIAAAEAEAVVVWAVIGACDPQVFPLTRDEFVHAVAFSGDDRLCLILGSRAVVLNRTANGPVRLTDFGPPHPGPGQEMVGTAEGPVVFASRDSLVYWDVEADRLIFNVDFPNEWGMAVFPTPDGRFVLAMSHAHAGVAHHHYGRIRILRFPDSHHARGPGWRVGLPALDAERDRLFIACGLFVERYDLASGRLELCRDWLDEEATSASYSSALDRLVVVTRPDGVLHILDPDTLTTVAAFDWHLGPVSAFALSPDGRFAATAGVEGVVKLWPLDRLLPVDPV